MHQAAPVTCVITSYNNETTLNAAIDSVLRQTLPVAEIIVADDCSTDKSQEMINAWATKAPCLRPVLRAHNIGVAANRDLALRAASQPFVTHLDGDDLFAERKIEEEWTVLARDERSVAYSYIAHIHPGRPWKTAVLDPSETVAGDVADILARLLLRTGSIPRDMLMSKSLYLEVDGFDHDVRMYEDWQFKMRLAANGARWLHSRTLGTLYYQRAGTLSKAKLDEHIRWKRRVIGSELELLAGALGTENLMRLLFSGCRVSEMPEPLSSKALVPAKDEVECARLMIQHPHIWRRIISYLLMRARLLCYCVQIRRCIRRYEFIRDKLSSASH